MKKNERVELHNKTESELKKMVVDLRSEIAMARIDIAAGKNKNTALSREKKKNIARILTILGQKEVLNG